MLRVARCSPGLVASLAIGACSDPLDVHIVGTVTDASVNNAAAANALRIGALGSVNAITVGGTGNFDRGWVDAGLARRRMEDVGRAAAVRRARYPHGSEHRTSTCRRCSRISRARGLARREAIAALLKYQPIPAWGVGQMYIVLAIAEMQLAEYFCNGTPLSGLVNGVVATVSR